MTNPKAILIVGCGAVGGVFAAALNSVAKVVAYDTHREHVAAIRAHGLQVFGNTMRVERIEAVDTVSGFAERMFDAVLLLTRSNATAAALQSLAPVLHNRPLLVTLQVGMGNVETLLGATSCPVARGVTMDAGRYFGPGRIEHLVRGERTWLGPIRGCVQDVRWFGELLAASGMPTEVVEDPMGAFWSKFVFNCVMNPIGALLLGVNAARHESLEVRALIDEMAAECTRVVEALGGTFAFDPMAYVKQVRSGRAPMSRHAGAMALDIARGAATEIDELTGYIVAEGDRLGIAVPACTTVYRLVKGLEIAARVRRPEHGEQPEA